MSNLIPLRFYLQLEGLVVFLMATTFYHEHDFSWWFYGVLFFTPDFFMLGYLLNNRTGALIYNLGHTYSVPVALVGLSLVLRSSLIFSIGLIWCAHIGFDRAIGYGLKYDSGFKDTHLNRLG